MSIRFRKKIKILPGVSINITKKGISSASIGGKGVTLNTGGKNGTKLTTGIPGTGISHTENLSKKSNSKRSSEKSSPVSKYVWLFFIILAIYYAGFYKG